MKITDLLTSLLSLFYPNLCVICGESLIRNEAHLCMECSLKLPKTNYHLCTKNRATERFAGKVPLIRASSYLYYYKEGIGQKLIAEIKYRKNQELGKWIGSYLAKDVVSSSSFFQGIDYLIPVPLHPKKLKQRGFNQAEMIAKGISQITNIPLEPKNLYRRKANTSQTKKGVFERWKNTQDIFSIENKQLFTGKHVLLIDDVLTTGATLEACTNCLLDSPNIKISFLTIAIA